MKVLCIEDDYDARRIIEELEDEGYEVKYTSNFSDAIYYLTDEQGKEVFNAIILDMDLMDIKGLPEVYLKRINQGELSGWVFFDYLKDEKHSLVDKVIIYTGYVKQLKGSIEENIFNELKIVNKNYSNRYKKLIDYLKEMGGVKV